MYKNISLYELENMQLFTHIGDWGGREAEAADLMYSKLWATLSEMSEDEFVETDINEMAEEIWAKACDSEGRSIGFSEA